MVATSRKNNQRWQNGSLKIPGRVETGIALCKVSLFLRMMQRILALLLFCLPAGFSAAQEAPNPFELQHRLPKIARARDSSPKEALNPFDVAPHRQPGARSAMVSNQTIIFKPFSRLPKGDRLPDTVLLGALVVLISFLTLIISANRKVILKLWRAFLNDGAMTVARREAQGLVGATPYYLFYANFLLQAGMFGFLTLRFFNKANYNNLGMLLICLFVAPLIFLIKHILLNIVNWLFPENQAIPKYNFLIVVFNGVLGLFLTPFNFLLAFGAELGLLLLFWGLGLTVVFYGYRALRAASIGSKFLAGNQFQFLLYLCSVEIAPVLILVKIILNQAF